MLDHFREDNEFSTIVSALIRSDVDSLLRKDVYQENNHGLMSDIALMRLLNAKVLHSDLKYEMVVNRLRGTLIKMFDREGVCLEHSVSYQEYNLGILADIKKIFPKDHALGREIEKIFLKSKEILGAFLLDNGSYVPVGDSLGVQILRF
ncbi:MAG: hypothetical protein MZV65_05135 [Chromatiales bacterium]|nr:hypothetical protein [Chromatiales bacterium]